MAIRAAPLLQAMAKQWKVVAAHKDASGDFLRGGYYAVPNPAVAGQELIVLNTAYWSRHYAEPASASTSSATSRSSGGGDRGAQELAWLRSKLEELHATHRTAALLMHIPPGVDAFASVGGDCSKPVPFWKDAAEDTFAENRAGLPRRGARRLCRAHAHGRFPAGIGAYSAAPFLQIHISPSIGRDHHNLPAFEAGFYGKASGALEDYGVRYLKKSAARRTARRGARSTTSATLPGWNTRPKICKRLWKSRARAKRCEINSRACMPAAWRCRRWPAA